MAPMLINHSLAITAKMFSIQIANIAWKHTTKIIIMHAFFSTNMPRNFVV